MNFYLHICDKLSIHFTELRSRLITPSSNLTTIFNLIHILQLPSLTLFRIGGPKRPPTSFSSIISTNVGISSQNFLTFSFNSFATLVQNFKAIPSGSPKLLNLNQGNPAKKVDFSGQILIKLRL